MFYFKACPKCRGDLRVDRDSYGTFCQCLQCGRIIDLQLAGLAGHPMPEVAAPIRLKKAA